MIEMEVAPPGVGEIQVGALASLVSAGTERAWVLGSANTAPDYPFAPGYCVAGRVEAIGPGVDGFSPGDRVACYANGMGHREIGNVLARLAVRVPDGVPSDHAAFASLGQTALQGIRKCRIELGETAAVFGLGIVGLLALRLAGLNGAVSVAGLDSNPARLEIARECGADPAIDCGVPGWERELLGRSDWTKPQVVLDCTGAPDAMTPACAIAADFARVCLLGSPRGTTEFNFYREIQKKSIVLIGAHAVDSAPKLASYPRHWTFADDADCFLRFAEKRNFAFEKMIGGKVSKREAESAYGEWLKNPEKTLGFVIDWT